MNIYEYQVKVLFCFYGVLVFEGCVVLKVEDVKIVVGELDGFFWVVKVQIYVGGCGKGFFKEVDVGEKGGVCLIKFVEEVVEEVKKMFGCILVMYQIGLVGK